ncbi:hypothetical protein [Halomarina litorea]|uniref:hypothetical protein n=1 Tax=Halomarina litorea TaxID=2961595 RepID=UPI0020C516B4|nr:hypothetical protein [Halomarina sp. BCD28]
MTVFAQVGVECNVAVASYDVGLASAVIDAWDDLPDRARIAALRRVPPEQFSLARNTTCVELHEWAVDGLCGKDTPALSEMAVGTNGTTPAETDRSLGNEVARIPLSSIEGNGDEVLTAAYLDEGEANGNTLQEIGLYADDRFLNHASISPVDKDASTTVTIEVSISFTAL